MLGTIGALRAWVERFLPAGFGLREGANSDPKEFVVEKAFVGDGI